MFGNEAERRAIACTIEKSSSTGQHFAAAHNDIHRNHQASLCRASSKTQLVSFASASLGIRRALASASKYPLRHAVQ
jgi:hypothetical protein